MPKTRKREGDVGGRRSSGEFADKGAASILRKKERKERKRIEEKKIKENETVKKGRC